MVENQLFKFLSKGVKTNKKKIKNRKNVKERKW